MTDWELGLIERVGIDEYNRQMQIHLAASVVDRVNGETVHVVGSSLGKLFAVGRCGFATLDEARAYAQKERDV
jgi:hypothetical protein